MTSKNSFNIRVYGICIENGQLLVVDEYVMNMFMTKFPGGGLEYGEGTIKCLKRECKEEMGIDVEVTEHFYTTDFFQANRFLRNTQLISIYYRFKLPDQNKLVTSSKKYDFQEVKNGALSFRWIPFSKLTPGMMTFPIDKKVVRLLLK